MSHHLSMLIVSECFKSVSEDQLAQWLFQRCLRFFSWIWSVLWSTKPQSTLTFKTWRSSRWGRCKNQRLIKSEFFGLWGSRFSRLIVDHSFESKFCGAKIWYLNLTIVILYFCNLKLGWRHRSSQFSINEKFQWKDSNRGPPEWLAVVPPDTPLGGSTLRSVLHLKFYSNRKFIFNCS